MKQKTLLKLAWSSILKNKMRTLLTMLGIVIGIGSVIVMVAVGQGAPSQIEAQINSLGTNLILITPGSSQQGGVSQGAQTFNRITVEDAQKLKAEASTLSGVSPVIFARLVAIARALVTQPTLLLADEPTGNLDSHMTVEVMALFQDLNEQGITILIVTHEPDVAKYAKRIVEVRDGHIIRDHPVEDRRRAADDLLRLELEDPLEPVMTP